MRTLAVLLCSALAATATAQTFTLSTPTAGGNSGNIGGGIYFDLQINTTVTITQIDFRIEALAAGVTQGALDIYLGPTTYVNNVMDPTLWTLVGSTQVVPLTVQSVIIGPLAQPFALGPGNYGVALRAQGGTAGFSHSYTNGVTCTSTTVPGSCANSLYSTAHMTFRGGAAQNVFLSGGVFSPRIWNGNIHYTLGGTPIAVASQQKYGNGCYGFYTSFYELFPNPVGLDLGQVPNNPSGVNTVLFTFAGDRYVVSAGTTPFANPASAPVPGATGNAIFTASSALGAPTLPFPIIYPSGGAVQLANELEISPDGYILPTTGNINDGSPTIAEFLTGPARWAPLWKNLDVGLGGSLHVEIETATGALLITWLAVRNDNAAATGGTTTNTFQVAFYPSGNVEYRYGVLSQEGGGTLPIIVGLTQGLGALDRGNLDISGSLPFNTHPVDNTPLDLVLNARPLLGTNPSFVLSGYNAATTLGALVLSFAQFNPGIPLGVVGAPGCFQFVGLDDQRVLFLTPSSTTVTFIPGGIPASTSLNGILLYGQGATFTSGFNQLGVITSNGLRMLLGSL